MIFKNVDRLALLCGITAMVIQVHIALIPALTMWAWIDSWPAIPAMYLENLTVREVPVFGGLQWFLCLILGLLPTIFLVLVLLHLVKLVKSYQKAEFFSDQCTFHLSAMTRWLFIRAVIPIVNMPLLSLILTMNNPPGEKSIYLAFNTDHLVALMLPMLLLIITRVMKKGVKLEQENSEIV